LCWYGGVELLVSEESLQGVGGCGGNFCRRVFVVVVLV